MRRIKSLLAAALIVPVAATASDSVRMDPGRWQENTTITGVTVGGRVIPLELFGAKIEPSYTCITPELALDPTRYFTEQGPDEDCQPPQGSVSGGRIALTSTCRTGSDSPTQVAVNGTYGTDAYRVAVRADGSMDAKPMVIHMVIDGRLAGPCQGDEKE